MAFERVYTVWDYWDGPRSGIAEYRGQAHYFRYEWDENEGDYAETCVLTPISQETLTLVMDQWSIWREWESAFHRGEVSESTHPAHVDPRYKRLVAGGALGIQTASSRAGRVVKVGGLILSVFAVAINTAFIVWATNACRHMFDLLK